MPKDKESDPYNGQYMSYRHKHNDPLLRTDAKELASMVAGDKLAKRQANRSAGSNVICVKKQLTKEERQDRAEEAEEQAFIDQVMKMIK